MLIWHGEHLQSIDLPTGSEVLYPPTNNIAAKTGTHVDEAIAHALENPLDGVALSQRLKPETVLTIAIDDDVTALNTPAHIDNRQLILESILTAAAIAKVEDVQIVVARGTARCLTKRELERVVGLRVYDSFVPSEWLTHHDAENADQLTVVGKTKQGEQLEVNKRVADSNLLIYIGINHVVSDGGWLEVLRGLGSVATARLVRDGDEKIAARLGALLAKKTEVLQIDSSVSGPQFAAVAHLLEEPEGRWNLADKAIFKGATALNALPVSKFNRSLLRSLQRPQSFDQIFVGSVAAAHKAAVEHLTQVNKVDIKGQTDVVVLGVPFTGPFCSNAVMNPLLALYNALVYQLGNNSGNSSVCKGGVVILHHPLEPVFDSAQHVAYNDFYHSVLSETRDVKQMQANFEERFANDRWYSQLYKDGNGYHGTHPFWIWQAIQQVVEQLSAVIVVGGNSETAERLGVRTAGNMKDALQQASDILGEPTPDIAYLHSFNPPVVNVL